MRLVLLLALLLVGCETVKIEERVVYEDSTPVQDAQVHQWTDEGYDEYTVTDENGEWALLVPPDTVIYLCIEDPNNNNEIACYECGTLTTPALDSNDTKMLISGCDDLEYVGS